MSSTNAQYQQKQNNVKKIMLTPRANAFRNKLIAANKHKDPEALDLERVFEDDDTFVRRYGVTMHDMVLAVTDISIIEIGHRVDCSCISCISDYEFYGLDPF